MEIKLVYFFPRGHGNESFNLIGCYRGQDFPLSAHGHGNARSMCVWRRSTITRVIRKRGKINKLFSSLASVHIVKKLLPLARGFSRLRSRFFTIRTSQPANNTYSQTSRKRPPKKPSLRGRVRELRPYWVKILRHWHMITAETHPMIKCFIYMNSPISRKNTVLSIEEKN